MYLTLLVSLFSLAFYLPHLVSFLFCFFPICPVFFFLSLSQSLLSLIILSLLSHCPPPLRPPDLSGFVSRLLQPWWRWLQLDNTLSSPGQWRVARSIPWSPWQRDDPAGGWWRWAARGHRITRTEPRDHHWPFGGRVGEFFPYWTQQELSRYGLFHLNHVSFSFRCSTYRVAQTITDVQWLAR